MGEPIKYVIRPMTAGEELAWRLQVALMEAGRSPLGFPASAETFVEWLARHGLAVTFIGEPR